MSISVSAKETARQTSLNAPLPALALRRRPLWRQLLDQRQLVWMTVPILLYIFLFTYVPLTGWTMAFQNYKPAKAFADQEWVGLQWFEFLFSDEQFLLVLRNTLCMSLINITLGFVTAILLALLLNELRHMFLKRAVQTISYLPHFLSMVIVASLVGTILQSDGILNQILMFFGFIEEPILWLGQGEYFWGIVGATMVWKEVGWNTIIYLAAIASIDPTLYEAAEIDGCNRYHKMWHITLPGMKPTIMVLMIMSIGRVLDSGFELQYLLGNGLNVDYSQTIDIFNLRYGIEMGNFALATAAGMFKSVVSITLVLIANRIAKAMGEERLI